jgi:hypothetical protein
MVFLAASQGGKLPESIPDPREGITDETIFIINSPMSPEDRYRRKDVRIGGR